MPLDVPEIAQRLSCALGADERPLLTQDEATRRAEIIIEETQLIGFNLQLLHWKNATLAGRIYPYPAYELNDPRYDLNATGPGEKGQFAINGPGISCGDLLKLGRAFEIKRNILPQWPAELKKQLRDPQQHLDALEEILWLGRFLGLQTVRPKRVQPNGKDVDWTLSACSQPLQIEVKNRRKECVGMIDGANRGRDYPSWYEDLRGKFSRDDQASLNIACVTTYFDPDHALAQRANELLESGEPIDALIVWSYFTQCSNALTIFAAPSVRTILSQILAPVRREDEMKVILLKHLQRNTEEQRVVTIEEGIAKVMETFNKDDRAR